jgi:hypothetical protein
MPAIEASTMNERWVAVSALCLLGACGGAMHEEKPNVEVQELRADVQKLSAEVERLTAEVERKPSPPPTEQQKLEALKELASRLQAKFDGEQRDERATADAMARLSKVASPQQFKVECRLTFCRLETSFPNQTAFDEFIRAAFLGEKAVWQSGYAIVKGQGASPNGPHSGLLFLTRPTAAPAPYPKGPPTP